MTDLRRMSVFRDVQVAMDFQQMAAAGYIDTEFTMYGCAYWEAGKRHYVVSSEEGDVWQFIEDCKRLGRCPTPLQSLKKVCPVPLGQKEAIADEVKVSLAEQLQKDYSAEFMQAFAQLAEVPNSNTAYTLVQKAVQAVLSTFSEEKLRLAEDLLLLAYARKVLTQESFAQLGRVLAHERDNLLEDVVAKDILHRNFYTIMYEAAPNQHKMLTNARREWILQKKAKLQLEGKVVTPIYTGSYWYNNQQSLEAVKARHQEKCQQILSADYFAFVKAIHQCQGPFEKEALEAAVRDVGARYGGKALAMLEGYVRSWSS